MTRVLGALWTWGRGQYAFSRISSYPSWEPTSIGNLHHDYLESSGEPWIVPISQERTRSKEAVTCPTQGAHPPPAHRIVLFLSLHGVQVQGWQAPGAKRREECHLPASCVTKAYLSGPRKHLQAQLCLSCPLLRCIIGSDSLLPHSRLKLLMY